MHSLRFLTWFLVLSCLAAFGQTAAPEKSDGLETLYDFTRTPQGYRVRTVVTRPIGATGRLPVLFFVGWLSCDSIIYPGGAETDGFSRVVLRLLRQSGFAAVRMDKPGVGESEGDCAKLDFQEELAAYRAVFRDLKKHAFLDPGRVVLVGLSNGGGVAPLVPEGVPVAGYVSIVGWGRSWLEHMLDHERERLTLSGRPPAEVNAALKLFPEFYHRYLVEKQAPGAVVRSDSRFATLWYDAPDGQYGRPAAFYQQLQDLNLGEAWRRTGAPVLVISGEYDWIMGREEALAIVDAATSGSAGSATLHVRPRMDHFFMLHESRAKAMGPPRQFDDGLVPVILEWLKKTVR